MFSHNVKQTRKMDTALSNASVNSSCAQPPPPLPVYYRAFGCLVSPRSGAFANFVLTRGRAFANPRPFPSFDMHARLFTVPYFFVRSSR